MSEKKRRPPADVLLLRERQRKLAAAAPGMSTRGVAQPEAVHAPPPRSEGGDEFLLEGDALVDERAHSGTAPIARGSLSLYRPLGYVTLGSIAWSDSVDHELLQRAIVCAPPRDPPGERAPQWLRAIATLEFSGVSEDEPALHVGLGQDDLAVLARLGVRFSSDTALGLIRAAALPSGIVGADSATAAAAGGILAAYRHAALVSAWQSALGRIASPDVLRERDATAVQVISMLRALLGET